MFLVLDRQHQNETKSLWLNVQDYHRQKQRYLGIARWRLRAGDSWYVTGVSRSIASFVATMQDPQFWQSYSPHTQMPKITVVSPHQLGQKNRSFWQKLFGQTHHIPLDSRWIEGIPNLKPIERQVLESVQTALSEQVDILILAECVQLLRPELRFRLSVDLRHRAQQGLLTLLGLENESLESWIAVEHRAELRRNRLQVKMRHSVHTGDAKDIEPTDQ